MNAPPRYLDTLRRLAAGELSGGGDDHSNFLGLRALRTRGLATSEVVAGQVRWSTTADGRALLEEATAPAPVVAGSAPDWSARDTFRAAKAAAGER